MFNTVESSKNRKLNLVLLGVSLAVSSGLAFSSFLTMPGFRSNFSAMGFDLPWFTQAALTYYPALLVLPLAVLAVWHFWPDKSKRGIACIAIGLGGSFFLVGLLVVALQYPTFQSVQSLGGAI